MRKEKEDAKSVAELIRQADAVLVGAGSGLSSAAGYNHYHRIGIRCGRHDAQYNQTSILGYDC